MIGRSFLSVLKDRRGAVAIVMAIALPVVIGAAGLGVEAGKWYMIKRQAQTAADTGAFAGALEIAAGTSNQARPAAVKETSRNGFTQGGNVTVTVNIPPVSGSYAGNAQAVEVIVTQDEPLLFATFFLAEPAGIVARAVGLVTVTGNACILSTSSNASRGLQVTGSAVVQLEDCSLASNSTKSDSIYFSGSSTIEVPSAWSAGGIQTSGSSATTFPVGQFSYAWPIQDPYANLTIPVPTVCDYSAGTYSGTLTPGVYYGGMKFGSGAVATLEPGTYYIDKGDFDVGSSAVVTCSCTAAGSGVTIVLTSSGATKDIGSVNINAQAIVTLRAPSDLTNPTKYPYPGMLFIQDRRAPSKPVNKLNGGANLSLSGALYFPNQEVQWSGNSSSTDCTLIVADTVTLIGNTRMTSSGCASMGLTPITAKYPSLAE
jgi:hypothetical protein